MAAGLSVLPTSPLVTGLCGAGSVFRRVDPMRWTQRRAGVGPALGRETALVAAGWLVSWLYYSAY